ncbi:MAG: SDR family NAD(P)-dependent oxidoreductase [Cytophagales bacterium]
MAFALVTGGSKGIGKEIAQLLAGSKHDLLLVARNEAELKSTANQIVAKYGVNVHVLACDLSELGASKLVFDWVDSNHFPVEILINNAGYGLWGYFETLSLEAQQKMLSVNMNALVELCHLFLPILKKNTKSYILNVSSTAAYQAVATLSLYAASKSFVLVFSRGLRQEVKAEGVSVSCLSPGATSTNFTNRAGMNGSLATFAEKMSMKSDTVAKIAVKGMLAGEAEIIAGFSNWISVKAIDFLPKFLIEKIASGIYTKHL